MTDPQPEPQPEPAPELTEPPEPSPEEEAAEEGEAGEGVETPEEPAQAESETEPPQAVVTEKEIEEGTLKLEKERTRHANRVSEIMGEAAQDLVPCELCVPIIPGFRWNRQPDEIVVERVREVIGLSDLTGFKPATDARKCDECDGKGRVLSGSRVEKYATVRCMKCGEKGYVEVGTRPAAVAELPSNGPTAVPREQLEERPPDTDPWGRPPTDPDYGVLPGFVRA